VIFLARRL